jgi:hypothetical protein
VAKIIITSIETFPLRIPFGSKSKASAWGDSDLPAADSLLVKVTTDKGLEGWGEAFGFRAVTSAKLTVDELIAPLCIGQDAARIGPLTLRGSQEVARLRTGWSPRLRHFGGGHRPLGYCGQGCKHTHVPASGRRRDRYSLRCKPGPLFRSLAGPRRRPVSD